MESLLCYLYLIIWVATDVPQTENRHLPIILGWINRFPDQKKKSRPHFLCVSTLFLSGYKKKAKF